MDDSILHTYIRLVVEPFTAPVGVSQRHVHLSRRDAEALFGTGYCLQIRDNLTQPGQFAAKETVCVVGSKGCIQRVRVLGPFRNETQVELSKGDCYATGIDAPVRMSGQLDGSPGCVLIGPNGSITCDRGVIIAHRHLHLSPKQAADGGYRNGEALSIRIGGAYGITLENVIVRAGEGNEKELHITIDEANAACVKNGDIGVVLKRGEAVGQP